jgi:hypothetical protein
MRLTVTAEDIRDGKRESCSSCPMALALNRAGFETAYVNLWFVRESANGLPLFSLSESAMQFVSDFDAGKPVQPATFVLRNIPEKEWLAWQNGEFEGMFEDDDHQIPNDGVAK